MNPDPTSPVELTAYEDVARAAELELWALKRLEQARFRVPENYIEKAGAAFLTIAGIQAMARTLEAHGYAVRAHSLRVLARQRTEKPSAFLPSPRFTPPVTAHHKTHAPWYQEGPLA